MSETNAMPSVSVVIPTHDRPEFVRNAVRSVLEQDYPGAVEALVVFDNSDPIEIAPPAGTNGARSVSALVNTRSRGAFGARNTGLLAAKGDLVAFLDDDDEWLPSKLARQVAVLRSRRADVVFTAVRYRAGDRYRDYVPPFSPEDPVRGLVGGGAFMPLQTMVGWREAVQEDLIDENFRTGGDQEFVLRLLLRLRAQLIKEPLVLLNRGHSTRLSMDYERKLENVEYMRAKHADLFARYRPDLSASHARFALLALGNGKRQEARTWAARSIRANPKRFRNWLIGLAVLAMPPMSLDSLQAVHHRIFWRRVRA
jgi:glycosyltransferase involved in cell wall biosynthesis